MAGALSSSLRAGYPSRFTPSELDPEEGTVMTETPTPAAAQKKGLSPLAWIGIGCLALLLISGVLFFSCSFFVAKKAKDFAGEFEKNPVKTTAEMAVKLHPNFEIVSTDDDEGTMTIRDQTNGEELTLSYKDIAEGRFSVQTEKGQVDVDTSRMADGGNLVTIEGNDGSKAQFGEAAGELPAWIPVYPGSEPSVGFTNTSTGRRDGAFSFSAAAEAQALLDFYREQLEGDGFEVDTATFPGGGTLTAKTEGREMTLFLAGWDDQLRVQGSYTETD
jgi:hypothetical protein